jgi:hypothetical protein
MKAFQKFHLSQLFIPALMCRFLDIIEPIELAFAWYWSDSLQ